jgi:hypothetical protein
MQQTDLTLVRGSKMPPSEPWAKYCDPSQVRKDSSKPGRDRTCDRREIVHQGAAFRCKSFASVLSSIPSEC